MVIIVKTVKKAIFYFDSSKMPGPGGIPIVVLKNCESDVPVILTDLFNLCLKGSCFPDRWKVFSNIPVFKTVDEMSNAKNYWPVSLLSVVCKVFEKLINDKLVRHLKSVYLFSDFQYGF